MRKIIKSAEYRTAEKEGFRYKIGGTWGLLYRFLIIICKLLAHEKELEKKIKRVPSAWSIFAGKQMKNGKTIKEAAELWAKQK